MKAHPAAELFPLIDGADFDALVADIRANGLREGVWLTSDGLVLDGRNRIRACEAVGIEPTFRTYEGDDPVGFVLSLNLHRRHLNESQRAMVAARIATINHGGDRRSADQGANLPLETVSSAAGKLSVGARTVKDAKAVLTKASPEVVASVERGDLAVSAAVKIAKRPAEEQAAIVERLDKAKAEKGTASAAAVLRQHERAKAADTLRNAPPALPDGPFQVIVADPPWAYEAGTDDGTKRGVTSYPTMTTEEICAMDVAALAADDCVLWLWTTNAFMRDAYRVLDAWGFEEKTILTWEKTQIGLGDYLRNVTEHCILAVRGRPTMTGSSTSTHFRAQRREHSRKPDEFFEIVEDTCPAPVGGYLELFCREPRVGWTGWGAEPGKFRASERVAKVEKLEAPKSGEPDTYADHLRLLRSRMTATFRNSHMQNHGSFDLLKRAESLLRMSAAIECPTCAGKSPDCRSCAGRGWVTRGDARALGKGTAA